MAYILIPAVHYFTNFLIIVIFIRVILSWLPVGRDNALVRMLFTLSEPILGPIRAALRKSPLGGPGMMLDFSPVIAVFAIQFVRYILIVMLSQILTR